MIFSKETPAAGGEAFAQFDAAWCYDGNGYIYNDTGTSLDVKIGASGSVQTLAVGATLPLKLTWSMAELYVRRTDQGTTQVTVEAIVGTGGGGGGSAAEIGTIADAKVAAHATDPAAHLNIIRRPLTGDLVLTSSDQPDQKIIPDTDRDVTLPSEGSVQWRFEICHGGSAHTVTVKRASGTTVASLIPGSPVVVAWDGVAFGAC